MTPPKNTHAEDFARFGRRLRWGCALPMSVFLGLRFAMDVYSGPSIALGLAITAGAAVALAMLIACAPTSASEALDWIVALRF